jgi:hypothetical protein
MNNYVTAPIGQCTVFNHTVKKFCIPELQSCNLTIADGLLYPVEWNCNKPCDTDREYYWPVPSDGKVMIQTRFNIPAGAAGWDTEITIELFDQTGNSQGWGTESLLDRFVIGRSEYGAYQTAEIDFSKIAELTTCGYFVITYGEDTYTTQMFRIENDCKCLVELEGIYTGVDCFNQYYGISNGIWSGSDNFNFSNKIYVQGSSKYFGITLPSTENRRVIVAPVIPPYMMRYLAMVILKAKNVMVNNEEWNSKDQTFAPRDKTSMFAPVIEVERKICLGADSACAN